MWIKICGVTRPEDALAVVEAGADAIGFNFYEPSPRSVTIDTAACLAEPIRSRLEIVGVFVNAPASTIDRAIRDVGLSTVQFHGNESADEIRHLRDRHPDVSVIQAVRPGGQPHALTEAMERLKDVPVRAILVDALVPGQYGGTGKTVDPGLLAQRPNDRLPLILAGGLTPDNVGSLIAAVRPWGVDTASGVESAPGIKSEEKIRAFVRQCRRRS